MRSLLAGLSLAVLVAAAPAVRADPPKTLDADVARLMKQAGTPGLALGIVENGKTVLAKGYGVRRLGAPEPVDAHTIFQIGSTTKAFTAAALAMLVEEGKIGWDDRVIDHLPEFQMSDPWVTREFTIRDLLTHRSGLPLGAGDLTFVPRTTHSRLEMMKALRHLKPETSFRTAYAYDNLLYVVAGLVVERVSGKTWEDFVRTRIVNALGMADTTTDEPERYQKVNRSQAHARLGPPIRGLGEETVLDERKALGPNANPAGGVMSSATDMSRWIATQLARGQSPDGKRLWSEASANEMWKGVTILPTPPARGPLAEAAPNFNQYALGWSVQDYRGHRIIQHAGGTLGFLTYVVLIPEKNVGFVIMQNSEDGELFSALRLMLQDHYLGLPPIDWGQRFHDLKAAQMAQAQKLVAAAAAPTSAQPPSLPLSAYAGAYDDAWYGRATVTAGANGLVLDMTRTPGMKAVLAPYRRDTFVARWEDPAIEPAYVTFAVGGDDKVSGVTLRAYSPAADFSFDYHDLDFKPARP